MANTNESFDVAELQRLQRDSDAVDDAARDAQQHFDSNNISLVVPVSEAQFAQLLAKAPANAEGARDVVGLILRYLDEGLQRG